ncbi:formin-like protein 20 [Nematostella vectensis]|uniref:formin-like protein 20 n=1 Tax=Nematostella vectensis TaxID=45351 RepID=UPI0020770404|nr:formin-like protein 20 [Nematostella vectensis]
MSDEEGKVPRHHKKTDFSYSRPKYREARWERAVKVYTVNLESKFLLVQGVPTVGATKELLEMFALYGPIQEYQLLKDYPKEKFTEVYWIKFEKINSARYAKRKTDNRSFFGGILHVSYAPEYETEEDTREKLQERRRIIAKKARERYGNQTKEPDQQQAADPIKTQARATASVGTTQTLAVTTCSTSLELASLPTSASTPIPQIPPPPTYLHPSQYPPSPPPWELPRVPSANATLPPHLQYGPPPPTSPGLCNQRYNLHQRSQPVHSMEPFPDQPPGPPPGPPPLPDFRTLQGKFPGQRFAQSGQSNAHGPWHARHQQIPDMPQKHNFQGSSKKSTFRQSQMTDGGKNSPHEISHKPPGTSPVLAPPPALQIPYQHSQQSSGLFQSTKTHHPSMAPHLGPEVSSQTMSRPGCTGADDKLLDQTALSIEHKLQQERGSTEAIPVKKKQRKRI